MKKDDKVGGAEFVDVMAELGEKHAGIISEALNRVAEEVQSFTSDDKLEDIHPVFISAGKGAYHGAMKFMMDKNANNFKVVRLDDDD